MPSPSAEVKLAAEEERQYIRNLSKKRRRWRHDYFQNRAEECLRERSVKELAVFRFVLSDHASGPWGEQIILQDNYIVDFYSPKTNVVIEIDGREHLEDPQLFADQVRDEHLRLEGTMVLRFFSQSADSWNNDKDLVARHKAELDNFLATLKHYFND